MKLTVLLSALAGCHAFTIPSGLEDGVYTVAIDARGNALSEPKLLQAIGDIKVRSPSRVAARQAPSLPSPSTSCHNRQLAATREEFDTALRVFNSVCDQATHYQAGAAVWISVNDARTVPYLCNYDQGNRCWSSESNEANNLINRQCGNTGIGWVYIDQYKKSYGRENKNQDGTLSIC